jgi:hypothetical protein
MSEAVNGKVYPMWSQFVEKQSEWIGGALTEFEGADAFETTITGIELLPNGTGSAYFRVFGKKFNCGFDVEFGYIVPCGEPGEIHMAGSFGPRFSITKARGEVKP